MMRISASGGDLSDTTLKRLTQFGVDCVDVAVPEYPTPEQLDDWWAHFCRLYEGLAPVAEEQGVKVAMHPSDIPLPEPWPMPSDTSRGCWRRSMSCERKHPSQLRNPVPRPIRFEQIRIQSYTQAGAFW